MPALPCLAAIKHAAQAAEEKPWKARDFAPRWRAWWRPAQRRARWWHGPRRARRVRRGLRRVRHCARQPLGANRMHCGLQRMLRGNLVRRWRCIKARWPWGRRTTGIWVGITVACGCMWNAAITSTMPVKCFTHRRMCMRSSVRRSPCTAKCWRSVRHTIQPADFRLARCSCTSGAPRGGCCSSSCCARRPCRTTSPEAPSPWTDRH